MGTDSSEPNTFSSPSSTFPKSPAMRVLDAVGISKPMVEEQVLALIKRTPTSEGEKLPLYPAPEGSAARVRPRGA